MITHVKEGDIEEVWFVDNFWLSGLLPLKVVVAMWGFDLRSKAKNNDVVVRVFVPQWWSTEQKEDLAETYISIIELKAGAPHGAD